MYPNMIIISVYRPATNDNLTPTVAALKVLNISWKCPGKSFQEEGEPWMKPMIIFSNRKLQYILKGFYAFFIYYILFQLKQLNVSLTTKKS